MRQLLVILAYEPWRQSGAGGERIAVAGDGPRKWSDGVME
jgi:hypothetical protein